jgi:hypothetical protein
MLLASHGCRFGTLTPALLHMLSVIEEHARFHDLTILCISATDSPHINDAHERGEAIDLRCTDPVGIETQLLTSLLEKLGPEFAGKVGMRFRKQAHLHLQLRAGVVFHPPPVTTHVARFNHR